MRTAENLPRHELIGLPVEIVESTDPNIKGLVGTVIDETRNMLIIEQNKREIRVPKKQCEFRFTLQNKDKVQVSGQLIFGRPEERLKKRLPKKWQYVTD